MIVFEKLVNKQLSQKQLENQAVEILTNMEQTHESQRERYSKQKLVRFAGSAGVELHLMFDIVFIGLVTDTGYSEDTAEEFMDDLHKEFTLLYKNNLPFIKRQ